MNTDTLTGSGVIVEYDQERIHSGKSYVATYKSPDAAPIADNGTIDLLVINGANPVHLIFAAAGNSDVEIQFYEATTVSNNGTQVPVVGLNRNRSLAQTPVVWRAPTVTAVGNLLYNDFRAYGVGAEFSHELEWVLRPNTNYLVRVINRAGQAQPLYALVHWNEF